MIKVITLADELARLTKLEGRTPDTVDADLAAAFAAMGSVGGGDIFTGCYQGDSAWERHPGDEMVHVLKGRTDLTILAEDGAKVLALEGGMICIVPQGLWHRFHTPDGVTVLSVTPQPTDHSTADDPT